MTDERRSDFDVTGTVQVSDPEAVTEAVAEIYHACYPTADFTAARTAFRDFRRLFTGELPGYLGCDTVYHDMQHSLDMTLAMARLMGGHERAVPTDKALGPTRMILGLVTALFHDSGYIRQTDDTDQANGAAYTRTHIARGVVLLERYLPTIGMAWAVEPAGEIMHFTGYERPLDSLRLPDPKHWVIGQLLGTADLMAQMADRCYLEKCRDRLYSEFVLGGVAFQEGPDGLTEVHYESGLDLLRKTPKFYDDVTRNRLERDFDGVYRYFADWFDGTNPYLDSVHRNLEFLERVLANDEFERLKRTPPVFTSDDDSLEDTQTMVALKLKDFGLED